MAKKRVMGGATTETEAAKPAKARKVTPRLYWILERTSCEALGASSEKAPKPEPDIFERINLGDVVPKSRDECVRWLRERKREGEFFIAAIDPNPTRIKIERVEKVVIE